MQAILSPFSSRILQNSSLCCIYVLYPAVFILHGRYRSRMTVRSYPLDNLTIINSVSYNRAGQAVQNAVTMRKNQVRILIHKTHNSKSEEHADY